MNSVVSICNKALSSIRARSINSLTESSTEAKQCLLWYETCRDFVLRDSNWAFATKTAVLQLLVDEPLRWLYAYTYPIDALKIQYITGDWAFKDRTAEGNAIRFHDQTVYPEPLDRVPYKLELLDDVKVIGTDQPEAYAVYTKKIVDPTLFDSIMEEALVNYLASKLAIPVIGGDMGKSLRSDAVALYQQTLSAAISGDQTEQTRPPRRASRVVEAKQT